MSASAPRRIGICGAMGRMGAAMARMLEGRDDLRITAVFDRPGTEGQSLDGRTLVTPEAAVGVCDVVVDFTNGEASAALATLAARPGGPALVIGSTGWNEASEAAVRSAGKTIAIVKSGNYSLGLNILAGLVEETARRLGARDWDIEISEAHHRRKVDSPSGTALMLGEAAATGRGVSLDEVAVRTRDGINGARVEGAIGFSVMRGGGIIGEHQAVFAGEEEILTLSHSALDRGLFARGALAAALWIADRPPGLYDMKDVLGFRS